MPRYTRYVSAAVLALTLCGASLAAEVKDPVFKAMQDELDRSVNRLVIEKMSRPYFLSYRIEDNERVEIGARYGALVESQRSKDRYLYVDLRVGDAALDNSNFVGDWGDLYNMRHDLAEEDDYQALRHQIWLSTDKAYKDALENLARKKAFLQTHPAQESLGDFGKADHLEVMDKPYALTADTAAWAASVRQAAAALRAYPALQDWKVTYTATAVTKRYLSSEGSRHMKGAVQQQIEVSATAQAKDGQRLSSFRRFVTRDGENPPQGEDLVKAVQKMSEELTAAVAAPALDEYSGPVLFTDYASAQVISQLFAEQLTLARDVLTPEDWMSQYFSLGKLAERMNRRVMPDFVTITDDPKTAEWKGHRLLGHQVVDDESVPSRTLTLVKEGRLVSLPSTRQPTKKTPESNGHARTLINQWTIPVVTNLFVKTDKPVAAPQMMEKLRRLAKDSGNEYGLLITRLEDERISNEYSWMDDSQDKPKLMTQPLIAYKVYAKDGRMEPVRGLIFDDVTIRSLRDISAMGKDEQVYGMLQPTMLPQVQYPVSIETPSILIEEMEFKANTAHEPLPVSSNPLFEK
ncbi:MAG TPA: metallopeptidase TldD-related protein [bacterium]|jgi:predicted Zn-dependent protease